MSETPWADPVESALARSEAQATEIVILDEGYSITRFRRGAVHQNIYRSAARAAIRALVDGRIARLITSVPRPDSLSGAVSEATALTRSAGAPSPLQDFVPAGMRMENDNAYPLPPQQVKDRAIRDIVAYGKAHGLSGSGAYVVRDATLLIATSSGLRVRTRGTNGYIRVVYESRQTSGYAEQLSTDFQLLNPEAVAREAAEKALVPGDPVTIPTGEYDVVLDEVAAADWLRFLGVYGFNGLVAANGASILKDAWGKSLASPIVTIWDDATDSRSLTLPFDFEGTPTRPTPLITRGQIERPVHDRTTAALQRTASTGHANLPFGLQLLPGPAPFHWHMAPGPTTREQLIASIDTGLLITRLNYTDLADRRAGILTGTSRDGTLLIERGEIRRPATDVRITDSLLGMLGRVTGVGNTLRLVYDWWNPMYDYSMCYLIPPVKIAACHINGVSTIS